MSNPIHIADRIQWHEGMLLAPQHFQQASRRTDDLFAAQIQLASPFCWGVRRMKMDAGMLTAGIVRFLQIEAVFPDGTFISFSADNHLHGVLEVDLTPHADILADKAQSVYLVMPLARRMQGVGVNSRFKSIAMEPVADEVSDAVAADIPRLLPNISLTVGAHPAATFACIRIGTVYKDNEVIKWSSTMPPLLEVPQDSGLWERVTSFCGQLRSKAAFVAKQTAVPSSKTEDRLAYLEQKERLRNLVTALPQLEAIMRTPKLHPYAMYAGLCGLLGPLSMLKPGSLPMMPPTYDHADPCATIDPILNALMDSLLEVNQEYREYKFEFKYGAFEIVLKPEWLESKLVIGLRGQPERDLVAWMSGAIIGSQSTYPSLRERRVLGAPRSHIEVAEELGVRASSGYTLFSIQADAALTLQNKPLVVSNSTESASAQRPQEMVLFVKG
jgi:type VI secretion system protein ImpJ